MRFCILNTRAIIVQMTINASLLTLALGVSFFGNSKALHQTQQPTKTNFDPHEVAVKTIGTATQSRTVLRDTTILNEVVLTDLKAPLSSSFRGATEVRVSAKDLWPFRTTGLAAALNQLAGIEINGARGPQGSVLSIYARGGRSKQALVIIDGIRVADPSSASLSYDLRLIDLSQIASLKVIKGANSSLYGTNAGVVVIDIKTKQAIDRPIGFILNGQLGTHQTAAHQNNALHYKRVYTGLSGRSDSWTYALRYSFLDTKGVSSFNTPDLEEDPFNQSNLRFNLSKVFSEKWSGGFVFEKQEISAAYDDAFMGLDANNTFGTIRNHFATQWSRKGEKSVLQSSISYASYDSEDVSAYGSKVRANNINGELVYRYFINSNWNLISGVQLIKDAIAENQDQGTEASDYTIVDPFASLGYEKGAFEVQLGGRYNQHSQYGSQWVYHFNPRLFLDDSRKWNTHFSIASAYITPTLGMFFGAYGANTELRPETNQNKELGLSYDTKKGTQWGVTYFDRKEQQAIFFNGPAFLYENQSSDTWAKGLEFQWVSNFNDQWRLQANYSWTEVSQTAIRIPKHKANTAIQYTPNEDSQWNLSFSFTGSRKDTNFSTYETVVLDAFSLVDLQYTFPLRVSSPFGKRLNSRGFVSFNNLLNASFQETVGYQTLGRNIRLGIEIGL